MKYWLLLVAFLVSFCVTSYAKTDIVGPLEGEQTVMFTLQALNSPERINLKKLFKKDASMPRAIVITFFASWCKPCKKELPHLQELYHTYLDSGLQVLAVFSEPDSVSWAKEWWAEQHIIFPLLNDEYGIVKKRYGITEYPTSFLIDKQGKIIKRFCGYSDDIKTAMDDAIAALLAE